MNVLRNENVSMWDVDDTLILSCEQTGGDNITVKDPLSGSWLWYKPHDAMIRLMREEKHRGGTIIVWSRGGYEWAEAVIKALLLEDLVTLIISKPLVYFDDKDVSEWLPYRVYLEPGTKYKR